MWFPRCRIYLLFSILISTNALSAHAARVRHAGRIRSAAPQHVYQLAPKKISRKFLDRCSWQPWDDRKQAFSGIPHGPLGNRVRILLFRNTDRRLITPVSINIEITTGDEAEHAAISEAVLEMTRTTVGQLVCRNRPARGDRPGLIEIVFPFMNIAFYPDYRFGLRLATALLERFEPTGDCESALALPKVNPEREIVAFAERFREIVSGDREHVPRM